MGLRNRSKAYRRRVRTRRTSKTSTCRCSTSRCRPSWDNTVSLTPKTWAAKIGSFDGYVFVTPEYNHGISGALKNAIDFLFREWNDKAAGFVSNGGAGGAARSSNYVW